MCQSNKVCTNNRQAVLTGVGFGDCLRLRMTEVDKLFVVIASAIVAALFVHRYADLPPIHLPTIIMVKATGGGVPTD